MSKTLIKQAPRNILLRLDPELLSRLKSVVPDRQRTRVISSLVEREVQRRERELEQAVRAVEADEALNAEMRDWDVTIADGIDAHVPPYHEKR